MLLNVFRRCINHLEGVMPPHYCSPAVRRSQLRSPQPVTLGQYISHKHFDVWLCWITQPGSRACKAPYPFCALHDGVHDWCLHNPSTPATSATEPVLPLSPPPAGERGHRPFPLCYSSSVHNGSGSAAPSSPPCVGKGTAASLLHDRHSAVRCTVPPRGHPPAPEPPGLAGPAVAGLLEISSHHFFFFSGGRKSCLPLKARAGAVVC